MRIRVDELSGQHIGKTVTIRRDDADITGVLAGIGHTADLITDQAICEPVPRVIAGNITYRITIGTMPLGVRADEVVSVDDHDGKDCDEALRKAFKRNS